MPTLETPPPTSPPLLPSDEGFSIYPETLPPYLGAVMFESFLYGVYTLTFAICLWVLFRRRQHLHWILFVSAILMYSIATADMGYTYYIVFWKLLVSGLEFNDIKPKYCLYVTNNVLADTLLLYRCYIVWGRNRFIIIGPSILLAATTVCGYIVEGTVPSLFQYAWVYLTMTFVLNIILTILLAGRIWWLAYTGHRLIEKGIVQRYYATIAVMVESGCLYSIYVVLNLSLQKNKVGSIILDAGLIQMVGIVPTLIIVQVGLGRAFEDIATGSEAQRTLNHHGQLSSTSMVNDSLTPIPSRHVGSYRRSASPEDMSLTSKHDQAYELMSRPHRPARSLSGEKRSPAIHIALRKDIERHADV